MKNTITARYSVFTVLYYINPRSDNFIYLVLAVKKWVETPAGRIKGTKLGLIGGKEEPYDACLEDTGAREILEEAGMNIDPKKLKNVWIKEYNPKFKNQEAKAFYAYELCESEFAQIPNESHEINIRKMRVDDFLLHPENALPEHYAAVIKAMKKNGDNRVLQLIRNLELPDFINQMI